jgi:hypothetical protein
MCPNTLQTQIMPASATISSGQRLDQLRTGLEHFHAEQSGQTSSPKSSCLSTTSAFTSAAMVSMLPRRVTDHDPVDRLTVVQRTTGFRDDGPASDQ